MSIEPIQDADGKETGDYIVYSNAPESIHLGEFSTYLEAEKAFDSHHGIMPSEEALYHLIRFDIEYHGYTHLDEILFRVSTSVLAVTGKNYTMRFIHDRVNRAMRDKIGSDIVGQAMANKYLNK